MGVNGEQVEIYRRERGAGKTNNEASKIAGINAAAYRYYRMHYELDSWKPGDPWPPPKKGETKSEPESKPEHGENVVQFAKS